MAGAVGGGEEVGDASDGGSSDSASHARIRRAWGVRDSRSRAPAVSICWVGLAANSAWRAWRSSSALDQEPGHNVTASMRRA